MRPLQVSAKLQNSVCGNDPHFPIDGILLYAEMKEIFGDGMPDPKFLDKLSYPDTMPLAKKHAETDYWYYAASFAQYENHGEYIQRWHKRFRDEYAHLIDFRGRRKRVIIGQGEYKAYQMPLVSYIVDDMIWYVVGEKERIEYLLNKIPFIGKKRAQGQGLVLEWEVKEIAEDWSEMRGGKWTRSIPAPLFADVPLKPGIQYVYRSYRPPYWHPSCFAMCTMQGEEAL